VLKLDPSTQENVPVLQTFPPDMPLSLHMFTHRRNTSPAVLCMTVPE
jgi:hypothetical protein